MVPFPPALLRSLLFLWPLQAYAANFTFSYSKATQCDDFQISWQGGTSPFTMSIIPSYGTPRNLNIPSTSFSNNQGSYNTTLPILKGHEIVVVLSDSTGFASGGISKVITVGASTSKNNCNTTNPGVDFYFETNSALAQCRTYEFSGYTGAVQPITIKGLVPGGDSFTLDPAKGSVFDWTVDVASGTELIFVMEDAKGRQGGSTQFMQVGLSDDNTCLSKNSPSSVRNAPSMTATNAPATSSSSQASQTSGASDSDSADEDSDSSNAGTVAAAVVGVMVGLAVVGSLIWFYLRRRISGRDFRDRFLGGRFRHKEIDLAQPDPSLPPPATLSPYPLYVSRDHLGDISTPNSTINLLGAHSGDNVSIHDDQSTINFARPALSTIYAPSGRGSMHESSVFMAPAAAYGAASQHGPPSQHGPAPGYTGAPPEGSVSSWDQSVTSSAARRKAAQAGALAYQPPARFILHTDIEDDVPPPPAEEIIELPPQYSERRVPLSAPPPPSGSGVAHEGGGAPYADSNHGTRP